MKAETTLVITPDGRVVPEGTESGFLWRLAGEEISDEEAERFGLRIVEPEVRRTRRRKE
jgi:hypothetical protein